jgi:hypothetical protein
MHPDDRIGRLAAWTAATRCKAWIDSPVAFMGCTCETRYQQAAIFDDVIKVLEELGPGLEPEAFRMGLAAKLDEADHSATGWRTATFPPRCSASHLGCSAST